MFSTYYNKYIVFLLVAVTLHLSKAAANQAGTGGKHRVLITHPEIPEKAINMLRDKGYELITSQNEEGSNSPSRKTLLKDIQGVHGAMWFGHVDVDQEMINAAAFDWYKGICKPQNTDRYGPESLVWRGNQLKVIGSMGAGYNHISVDLLYERDVRASNTPNVLSSAVADMALGLALAVSRNIIRGANAVKEGKWVVNHPSWMCGPTFEEATVGVVGLGAIGQKIVQRLKAFDVKEVLYYNRSKKTEDIENGAKYTLLHDLLKSSDFVFLAVPSNKETKNLIAKDNFETMKKTAILINSARGDVVNQNDLIAAIKKGEIGGAGLDVTDPEPLPADNELLKLDNVVVTPHISSATLLAREKMAVLAAENIICVLEGGQPKTPIPKPTA